MRHYPKDPAIQRIRTEASQAGCDASISNAVKVVRNSHLVNRKLPTKKYRFHKRYFAETAVFSGGALKTNFKKLGKRRNDAFLKPLKQAAKCDAKAEQLLRDQFVICDCFSVTIYGSLAPYMIFLHLLFPSAAAKSSPVLD